MRAPHVVAPVAAMLRRQVVLQGGARPLLVSQAAPVASPHWSTLCCDLKRNASVRCQRQQTVGFGMSAVSSAGDNHSVDAGSATAEAERLSGETRDSAPHSSSSLVPYRS